MPRSLWRTCSRSRAITKSSTPGFLPTCFEADCSFSGFLRTAGNVLLRPAKLFDRFPRAAPQEGISSLSFGEVAIGSARTLITLSRSRLHAIRKRQKLGYRSLSAYITALIRYDLLVGGPHSSTTADCRSKLQRKLTRKTLADRRKGRRRKILLDHLIEKREGRPVAQEELERVKARIVKELRRISFSPGSAKMPAHTISFQREPIRTSSHVASTVKVERSAASNTFTARSER